MNRTTTVRRWLIPLGITLFLAGCAVMRIDVDVYKGPLANHEDVQTQQMAVMAIGAKPLLLELCKRLEPEEEMRSKCKSPRNGVMVNSPFTNPQAKRVHDILTLYYDQFPNKLAPLIREGSEALAAFEKAFHIIRPIDEEGKAKSRTIWKQIETGLKTELTKPDSSTPHPRLAELRDSYKSFFRGDEGWRDQNQIYNAHMNLQKDANDREKLEMLNLDKLLDGVVKKEEALPQNQCTNPRDDQCLLKSSANSEFEVLLKSDLVRVHANLLFQPEAENEKELFISRVREIAKAFLDARKAMEQMLRLTLSGIILLHEGGVGPDMSVKPLQRAAAKFAASLIRPKELWFALHNKEVFPHVQRLRSDLKKAVGEHNFTYDLFKNISQDEPWFQNGLVKVLGNDNGLNARLLLDAHLSYINGYDKPDGKFLRGERERKAPKGRRRLFGIAAAPVRDEIPDVVEISGRLRAVVRLAGGGLDRGRLAFGLETLIEAYLETHHENGPEDDRTNRARGQLLDALVRFAEKILFIANHSTLIEDTSQDRNNGDTDCCESRDTQRLNRFVIVLQAVGNSILVQADELQHRNAHGTNLADAGGRESLGVHLAYSSKPHKVLNDLALAMSASQVAQTPDAEYEAQSARLESQKQQLETALATLENQPQQLGRDLDQARTKKAAALEIHKQRYLAHLFVSKPPEGGQRVLPDPKASPNLLPTFQLEIDKIANEKDPSPLPASAWPFLKAKIDNLFISSIADRAVANKFNDVGLLSGAQKGFNAVDSTKITEAKIGDGFTQLRNTLAEQLHAANEDLVGKAGALKTVQDKADSVNERIKDSKDKIDALEKVIQQTKANRGIALEIQNTLAAIRDYRDEVLSNVVQERVPPAAERTIHELLRIFEREKQDPSKKTQMTDAIKHVNSYPIPMEAPLSPATNSKSAKEVLDDVIALLRQEHIKAISQLGPNSGRAQNIEAALKAAYEHRSGMVYIRPSGAYLRSSYPSTSLQSDPGLAWKNLLERHSYRSWPLVGESIANSEWLTKTPEEARKITAEIDKQFWQNVNSVRVAGGGDTNYVIAKDDIGNWYIKAYSANPKDIIESAQNLAMFSVSGPLGTDLVNRLPLGQGTPQGTPGTLPQPDAQRTRLERVFDRYKERYEKKTREDHEKLVGLLDNEAIPQGIGKKWDANNSVWQEVKKPANFRDALNGVLTSSKENLTTLAKNLKEKTDKGGKALSTPELGLRIVEALEGIKRFHNLLSKNIRAIEPQEGASDTDRKVLEEAKEKAIRDVSDFVREELIKFLARRKETVKEYETSIVFLGDVIQPQR